VDDWIRHSITKASWWHFVAAETYRKRAIQLGEDPARVFNVGDPGLDSVRRILPLDREALARITGLPLQPPLFLVTYHPATLGQQSPESAFTELLTALEEFPDATIVLTKPNADAGGRKLGAMAENYAARHPSRVRCFASLGQRNYLSLMRIADVVIGNSSSGIVEAPPLKVPSVNIGTRQDGRLRASSIVDCPEQSKAIVAAIRLALSSEFRAGLVSTVSLYGDCNASAAIRDILVEARLPSTLGKKFHDL
jgi:UDP-N-acetylglucosamine 2-epimerase (non-hydrolysing)/GDP/UDP-N,N'-diacetylbacillosamine 2-epimerase (hydrolysing)